MNNYWAFLPMLPANDLLGDEQALREKFEEDGFLYLTGVIDVEKLQVLRRQVLQICKDKGWVQGLVKGKVISEPFREGDDRFFEVYDEVQKLEKFHELAHDPVLLGIMKVVLGADVFPHPLKIARLVFPENYEVTTPPHQDYLNNLGSKDLTAAWIPLEDCPMELGGIAMLKGSHKYGVAPLKFHLGAGNRMSVIPPEMQHLHWYATDFSQGDVLLFPALTMHASLHNASEFFMRLSVDYRYQREGEPLTEICLNPHFQRLTWDEIYKGWKSKEYQYYWKDHRYTVEPYDRVAYEAPEMSKDDMKGLYSWQAKVAHRMQKRKERYKTEE